MAWASWVLLAANVAAPAVSVGEGEVPAGWVVVEPPATDVERPCGGHDSIGWAVSGETDRRATIAPRSNRSPFVGITLPDGAMVGTNRGEWRGTIEWIPLKPSAGFVVENVNPVAVTQYSGEVFIAEGLAHGRRNNGMILRFERRDASNWRIHKFMDLGAAPIAAVRTGKSDWIVLTYNGVTRVDLARQRHWTLYENLEWAEQYPSSIRPLGRSWLIGTRNAVIRLVPLGSGYVEQRLVRVDCK